MSRLTEERVVEICKNHLAVEASDQAWDGADDPLAAVAAFEDRADMLDELEAMRYAQSGLVEAVAERRIEALGFPDSPWSQGRANAFTEVLRAIAPRVPVEAFATVADLVKAIRKDPGP